MPQDNFTKLKMAPWTILYHRHNCFDINDRKLTTKIDKKLITFGACYKVNK